MRKTNKHNFQGFGLPAVLIGSVVMLMVLATAVTTTISVRSALQEQAYTDLAHDAGLAGAVYADACLRMNGNAITWSDAQPLKPNTDCNGVVQEDLSAYVSETDQYRTYFVVGKPAVNAGNVPVSSASRGYIEVIRSSTGIAWKVFSSGSVSALGVPGDGTPVGTSIEGYWATAPEGYLLEDGSAVSRTTYATLFSVIGTTHGAGNGTTTFNLPDSRGRVAVALKSGDAEFDTLGEKFGEKNHILTINEMPNHNHSQNSHNHSQNSHNHSVGSADYMFLGANGNIAVNGTARAFPATGSNANFAYAIPGDGTNIVEYDNTNATTATNNATTATNNATTATNNATGGGAAHNNIQPSITLNRAIKY